ncbi:MAG: hypothetical protein ACXACI_10475 [Candidatus Hodarchaeales archaeon]|jgi:hypothetical protein
MPNWKLAASLTYIATGKYVAKEQFDDIVWRAVPGFSKWHFLECPNSLLMLKSRKVRPHEDKPLKNDVTFRFFLSGNTSLRDRRVKGQST